jgi:hypothetical protein
MATKEVTLKVENRWMDSLETACLHIQSPSGKTIVISKIELFDVELSEKVKATLRRVVRGTKLWDEVDFVSNVEEMKDLLSIASRMY